MPLSKTVSEKLRTQASRTQGKPLSETALSKATRETSSTQGKQSNTHDQKSSRQRSKVPCPSMPLYFLRFVFVFAVGIFQNELFLMCVLFEICEKVLGVAYVFETVKSACYHRFTCFLLRRQFLDMKGWKKKRAAFCFVFMGKKVVGGRYERSSLNRGCGMSGAHWTGDELIEQGIHIGHEERSKVQCPSMSLYFSVLCVFEMGIFQNELFFDVCDFWNFWQTMRFTYVFENG